MEIFYSDKVKNFKCGLEIDGAGLDNTQARLSLAFNNDKTKTKYLYEGKVYADGSCLIKIPEIKHSPNLVGKVTLEVIAENTYFEPWKDTFIIKQHKNVSVKKIEEEIAEEIAEKPIMVNVTKDNKISNNTQTKSKTQLTENLKEIINEDEYVNYVKNIISNKSLMKEYTNYEPKFVTTCLGEMYGIKNESKKEKSILFYIEKNIL